MCKAICVACGERPVHCKQRCRRCHWYKSKHGVDRPAYLNEKQKFDACIVCGNEKVHGEGRCANCYGYWVRHGVERPLVFIEKEKIRKTTPKWCKVCNQRMSVRSFRCDACYEYWLANKKERPMHLWNADMQCKNCKKPLNSDCDPRRGYCNACRHYFARTGKKRPPHLWGNGPHGFCDCGKPANHMIDKFPLCDECAVEYKKGAYS